MTKPSKVEPLWHVELPNVFAGSFIWVSDGGIVLRLQPDLDGDRQEVIACFDAEGRPVWERRFDFDSIGVFRRKGESLYVDGLMARRLSARTGETLAERDLGGRSDSYAVIDTGPVLYLEDAATLVGLDAETLEDRWRWPDPTGLTYAHDGLLCRYDLDGTIELVELPSLKPLRRVQGPARAEYGTTHGHLGDLWCQMYDLVRIGIDTRTGRIAWQKEEKEYGYHHLPTFVEDAAYGGDRGLSAYDLRTGEIRWRQPFGTLSCLPEIEGDRIYGAVKGGLVYVVDRRSGNVVSSFDAGFSPRAVRPLGGDRVLVASYQELLCFARP